MWCFRNALDKKTTKKQITARQNCSPLRNFPVFFFGGIQLLDNTEQQYSHHKETTMWNLLGISVITHKTHFSLTRSPQGAGWE